MLVDQKEEAQIQVIVQVRLLWDTLRTLLCICAFSCGLLIHALRCYAYNHFLIKRHFLLNYFFAKLIWYCLIYTVTLSLSLPWLQPQYGLSSGFWLLSQWSLCMMMTPKHFGPVCFHHSVLSVFILFYWYFYDFYYYYWMNLIIAFLYRWW